MRYPDPPPLPSVPVPLRIALVVGIALQLVPIWLHPWPALGGWAAHVQMLDVVMRHADPATLYADVFALPRHVGPGLTSLGLAWLLPVGDGLLAGRLLLSLYVAGLPWAFLSFLRWMRRDPALALLALPLTWNSLVGAGMLDDLLALPLLFVAFGQGRAFAEHGGWLRGLGLAALLATLLLTHVFAFGVAVLGVGFLLIWHRQDAWGLTRLWVILPSTPLAIAWFFRKFIALDAAVDGQTLSTRTGFGLVAAPWRVKWFGCYDWSIRIWRDHVDLWLGLALFLVWLLLLGLGYAEVMDENRGMLDPDTFERRMFGRRSLGWFGHQSPGWDRRRKSSAIFVNDRRRLRWVDVQKWVHLRDVEILTLLATVTYFALPGQMHGVDVVAGRLVVPTCLLWCAWPRLTFTGGHRWLALPMLLLALASAGVATWELERAQFTEIGALPRQLAGLPAQTRLAIVHRDTASRVVAKSDLDPLAAAMFMVAHGGVTDTSQALKPWSPIQYRRGALPESLEDDFWNNPHVFDYQHVLVVSGTPPVDVDTAPNLRPLWHATPWWLYEVEPGNRAHIQVIGVGSHSGRPAYDDCPRGATLSGLEVEVDQGTLRGLRAMCRDLPDANPPPHAAEVGRLLGSTTPSSLPTRLQCSKGLYVVGLSGRWTSAPEAVQLDCAAQPWPGARAALLGSQVVGGEDGNPFQARCPEGMVGVGIQGRFGQRIEQLALACAPLTQW